MRKWLFILPQIGQIENSFIFKVFNSRQEAIVYGTDFDKVGNEFDSTSTYRYVIIEV